MNQVSAFSEDDYSYFDPRICVIGSGSATLSHAVAFSEKYRTIWFDPRRTGAKENTRADDGTPPCSAWLLQDSLYDNLKCASDIEDIHNCNFYIIHLATLSEKIDRSDQSFLLQACELVGKVISGGDIVVFNPRVCPTLSEKECISMVERVSGLTCNNDFFAGYSPGTFNVKCTPISTPEIVKIVNEVYFNVFGMNTFITHLIGESEVSGVG
ncbi:MAG: hypothetical protein LLF80_06525 [Porphyromonadaceae bacterium]|nr:hypothetical protein [Porphyromonadaceae bacterium]